MIDSENIKKNFLKIENIFVFIITIIIFCLDRYSKNQIIYNYAENTVFVNKFINLELIWNTGIGFGLLSTNSSLIYNLVTTLIGAIISILVFFSFTKDKTEKFIFWIIIGGAAGNFYDRLVFQAVPDFIDLHFNNFHWFTFNVADVFISIGIIAFILRGFSVKNSNE